MKAPHLGGGCVGTAFALWLTLAPGPALAEDTPPPPAEPASPVAAVVDAAELGNRAAAEAQALIDKLSDDTDALASEYRKALQETESLKIYNRQLEDLLASQDKEMASLERQIGEVDVVQRQITPLMLRMIDTLEQFVRLDVPFLPEERAQRVAGLREMMGRADVSLSEKYRRLMEAYQVESEYGRTIEAYRGTLDAAGEQRTVDFLRVGRVALMYQTLDGQEVGFWDRQAGVWQEVPGEYRSPVKQGLQIAKKQVAPDLIRIPVPAPEVVAQ
jgi:hypothetical protein